MKLFLLPNHALFFQFHNGLSDILMNLSHFLATDHCTEILLFFGGGG
jgi:hypothetical protein